MTSKDRELLMLLNGSLRSLTLLTAAIPASGGLVFVCDGFKAIRSGSRSLVGPEGYFPVSATSLYDKPVQILTEVIETAGKAHAEY
jgi:hypothetical protein